MQRKIHLISFGHKYGIPKKSHINLSAKHFPNPSREIREKYDGRSIRLQNELYSLKDFKELYLSLFENVFENIKKLQNQVKSDETPITVIIAIGCEEGKHRSVAIVEKLAIDLDEYLKDTVSIEIEITHRDLGHRQKQIEKKKQFDQRRKEKRNYYLINDAL